MLVNLQARFEDFHIPGKKMKNLSRLPIFLAVAAASVLLCHAQSDTKGDDFWLSFIANESKTDAQHRLYICAEKETGVRIEMPETGFGTDITVPAGDCYLVDLPSSAFPGYEGYQSTAIRVRSDLDVNVFALNYANESSDATIVLPEDALGSDYLFCSYKVSKDISDDSRLMLVGAGNGAQILISYRDGTTDTVELNRGQAYAVSSRDDLTGTRVRDIGGNDVKFAVFAGNECAQIPPGLKACDHLYEQLFPIPTWGEFYIAASPATRRAAFYRTVAAEDSTYVVFDYKDTIRLNAGGYFENWIQKPIPIKSNKPISVTQFSPSYQHDFVDADPFMIDLVPLNQSMSELMFQSFNLPTILRHYVTVVTWKECAPEILLDGIPIGNSFVPLPSDARLEFARIEVGAGPHLLSSENSCGFNAYAYGYSRFDSYGYSAGARADTTPMLVTPDVICLGETAFFELERKPYQVRSYLWEFDDGDISREAAPSKTYEEAGIFDVSLRVEYANLENGFETTTLRVVEAVADFDVNVDECTGKVDIEFLSAARFSTIDSVYWDYGDGTFSNSRTDTSKQYYSPGSYEIRHIVFTPEGCVDSASVEINIPNYLFAEAGGDRKICYGDSATIDITYGGGSPPFVYEWTPREGLSDPESPIIRAAPDSTTTYRFKITDSNGCEAIDSITVFASPEVTMDAIEFNKICYGDSVEIGGIVSGGVVPLTIEWEPPDGLADTDTSFTIASPGGTTFYKATVTDGLGCETVFDIEVAVIPEIIADLGEDFEFCIGDSVILYPEITGGQGKFDFEWSSSGGGNYPNSREILVSPREATVYEVKLIDSYGCAGMDSIRIAPLPLPEPKIIVDGSTEFCSCDSVELIVEGAYVSYDWNDGAFGRTHAVKRSGDYFAVVEDIFGCKAPTDTVSVTVLAPDTKVYFDKPTYSEKPGGTCEIILLYEDFKYLDDCEIFNYKCEIRLNKSVLVPLRKGDYYFVGPDRIISLSGTRTVGNPSLDTLKFLAALGSTEKTPLEIERFEWTGCPGNIRTENSNFELLDLCKAGGNTRLLFEGESLSARIYPNPAAEKLTIEIFPVKEIFVRSHLINIFGENVSNVSIGEPISFRKEIVLDLNEVSAGSYVLSICSDEETLFIPLRVIK